MNSLQALLPLLLAGAQSVAEAPSIQPEHLAPPPETADVKTPAPPAPFKEPISLEEELARHAAVESAPVPSASTRLVAGTGLLAGLPREVHFDLPGDGRIWAVGDRYKASFGAEGATYIPFFGSRAPRSYPVHFAIRSMRAGASEVAFDASAEPVREGNRIVFDRGIVDEVYELSLDGIEQIFVFDSLPDRGELVIELAAGTGMERSTDEHGLVFESGSGSVRYTSAVAIDARGSRSDAPTAWNDERISIRVAAGDVERAAFPLVVDPLISTFDVDGTSVENDSSPDVAYDSTYNRWLVVYERVFSASDHDVYATTLTLTGGFVSAAFLDSTNAYWADPSVANNGLSDLFLAVAEVGSPTGGNRIIRGRTRHANTGTLGSQFTISGSETGEKTDPVVGGDPSTVAPTNFCVVWRRLVSSTDSDIHLRTVSSAGTTLGSVSFLSNSAGTLDGNPAISKSDGSVEKILQEWKIVWTRSESLLDNDLYGATRNPDGSASLSPFAIDTSLSNTVSPSVSTGLDVSTRDYLVAYTLNPAGGTPRTYGKLMRGNGVLDSASLSSLSGAPTTEKQITPAVDSDGLSFVVVNAETSDGGGSDYNVFASTFVSISNTIVLSEGHKIIGFSPLAEDQPRVVCPEGSGEAFSLDRPAMAVWRESTATGFGDILGATYELSSFASFCTPGVDGVLACPCGNAPNGDDRGCDNSWGTGGASLTASGDVDDDSVLLFARDLTPNALCIFGQGSAITPGGSTAFGDGIRCAGGSLLRLAIKSAPGGIASFPGAGDPSITERAAQLGAPISSGDKRYYYTYYRDPNPWACAATYNSTNAAMVQW